MIKSIEAASVASGSFYSCVDTHTDHRARKRPGSPRSGERGYHKVTYPLAPCLLHASPRRRIWISRGTNAFQPARNSAHFIVPQLVR